LNDIRRISRFHGQEAVGVGVIKQRGTNAVAVGDAVKAQVRRLGQLLPRGLSMGVVTDTTKFIRDSTNELLFTLAISIMLTSLVCWIFLGSWSSALNVILAIPTSLMGCFIVLYFMGFTLNTFTLLGLSLSVGIIVDDAIMVLENIVRHRESGEGRVEAALLGARQITTAALASTLAILAIFLPVIFMRGIIGRFFFQFGVTMSGAVLFSLLEALTLAPMRSSQFLRTSRDTRLAAAVDRAMGRLASRYRDWLAWCLDRSRTVLAVALAVFLISLLAVRGARREFVPPQDQSRFLVTLYGPIGVSLAFMDEVFRQAESALAERPEVQTYYIAIGGFQGGQVNQGIMFVTMRDPRRRPVAAPFRRRPSQQQFMAFMRGRLARIPGVERVVMQDLSVSGFSAQRGFPIEFTIQGPQWDRLVGLTKEMMRRMEESRLMSDIDTDYQAGMPEISIFPDRTRAARHGVPVATIANAVSAMVGGLRIGRYTDEGGHRDDIRVKLVDDEDRRATDIQDIRVRNLQLELIPLASLVALQSTTALLQVTRYNRQRAISVFANVASGRSQADALDFVERASRGLLPPGYRIVLSGSSQTFRESFSSLMVALVLGIFVAYMVLASQFNSFIHPWTILLALPFSVTGALLTLRAADISLNIYSMIGILLLMGIVKKNSILLVDFTNQRRGEGLAVREALLSACPIRLRPILMTSAATVAAAVPAALAVGPGAEVMRPMAVVVIGGVALSTALSLFVVPCAYRIFSRWESPGHQEEVRQVWDRVWSSRPLGPGSSRP
jgi:HAE1 family hydrophobic/amphiphilic exporter-1